jgi:hypothetical protein
MSVPPQTPHGVPERVIAGASTLLTTARHRSQRIIVTGAASMFSPWSVVSRVRKERVSPRPASLTPGRESVANPPSADNQARLDYDPIAQK